MRILLTLTIAYLCCTNIGLSQSPKADSLQSILQQLEGKQEVEALHRLIVELWFEHPDKAKQYAKRAISISTALENIRLQSISFRLMGGIQTYQGEYDLSLIYTGHALDMALQINDSLLIANSLNNIGFNYYNLGNYSEAMENFLRALNIKKGPKNEYVIGYMKNNIGLIYLQLKKYTKAREYFNQALEVGLRSNDNNTILYASNNLGFSYLAQGNYSKAEQFFKEATEVAKNVNNKNWEATTYSGLGQTYFELGRMSEALKEFKNSLALRNKIRDLKGISEIYYYLSKMSARASKLDSAMYYIGISQSIAEKAGTKGRLLENFMLYKELYTQQKQYDSALLYQSRYIELREKQFDDNSASSISGIHLKIKEEETLSELAAKDIQLAKKSFQLNFLIALAIFIFSITIVIFWFYKTQKKLGRNLKIKNLKISNQRDEIIRKNEELNNLNIEKNDLISIVSHDLKSPLNNIRGLINIIKLPPLPPENRAVEYIDLINQSTIRLSNMIEKILNIEAIESKKTNIKLEKINLSEVVHATVNRFEVEAARKQIQLHTSITKNVMIKADESYIDQVIVNLLSNAIKFSPKGKNIFINVTTSKNKALVEIKDEGPGISEDDKKKLFRKYQKLSNVPTANESSTGLGLSIVKKFVGAMKGEIWCESEVGKGASFFVRFVQT